MKTQKLIHIITAFLFAVIFGACISADTESPALGVIMAFGMFSVAFMPMGAIFATGLTGKETPEEVAAHVNLVIKKLDERVEKQKKLLDEVGIDEEKAKTFKEHIEALNELKEAVRLQGEEMTRYKKGADRLESSKSFRQVLEEKLLGLKDDIKNHKEKGLKEMMTIEIPYEGRKAAGTMTVTGNVTGDLPIPMYEPGLALEARRMPYLMDIVSVGTIASDLIRWAEQVNRDGGAGMTAEGNAKTQADFDIITRDLAVRKITSYIKVAEEMIDDIPYITSEINNELRSLVETKADDQILSGDNTGNNLKGILQYAATFAAGSLASTIDNANNFDVIHAALSQIMLANQPMPTYVVVNPEDFIAMKLTKDTNGQYLFPVFMNGIQVAGIPTIVNTGITAGTFLLGYFPYSGVFIRKAFGIQIGRDSDDFTKNLYTIIGEMRLVHRIKTNHATAFVQGTFSTAKAALETP